MLIDLSKGLWVFGGPYSGKTTLAGKLPDALESDTLLDAAIDVFNECHPGVALSRKDWRPDSPNHKHWAPIGRAVREQLAAHALRGGVAIAHDPPPAELQRGQINVVWLHPGDDELARRAKADNNPSRYEAFQHWQAKSAKFNRAGPKLTESMVIGIRLEQNRYRRTKP